MKKTIYNEKLNRCIFALVLFFVAGFILINIFYNIRNLESVLPMTKSTNQKIYQEYNAKEKSLPDAYLRSLIRERKITVPYKFSPYINYNPIEDEDERGASFKANYFRENNYSLYFSEYAKECCYDDNLPRIQELSDINSAIVPILEKDFTNIGLTNDLLRYTFLLNQESSKETTYFWYAWYYYSFAEEKDWYHYAYVQNGVEDSNSLVAVWDHEEQIYIMTEDYYINTFEPAAYKAISQLPEEVEK